MIIYKTNHDLCSDMTTFIVGTRMYMMSSGLCSRGRPSFSDWQYTTNQYTYDAGVDYHLDVYRGDIQIEIYYHIRKMTITVKTTD